MNNPEERPKQEGAEQERPSLERRLLVAEVSTSVLKELLGKQSSYIQRLEKQVAELMQEVGYLRSGGPAYERKTWLEKVVHCLEDTDGELMSAAEILRHLEQRDGKQQLAQMSDARRMLSVVLSRGVKTGRLYTDCEVGVSGKVYGVN